VKSFPCHDRPPAGLRLLAGAFLLFYGLGLVALLGCILGDGMIFQPPTLQYRDGPQILKVPVLGTTEIISARFLPNPKARFVLLYNHGTGDDLGELAPLLEDIRAHGYAVFAYDYEGYGTSSGMPSEKSVYRDAEAAYAYLTEVLDVSPQRIILYGFSLGGAPAVYLAARHDVPALVLESTFVSAFRVRTRLPLLPFDRFDNLSNMPHVKCTTLILHSRDDPVIGVWHAEALHDAAGAGWLVEFESGGHGDARMSERERYWSALTAFTASVDEAFPVATAGLDLRDPAKVPDVRRQGVRALREGPRQAAVGG
jgi:abhydrolase domain-containing protein 17